MRLTAKFLLALVLATALVLGADGWLRVRRESATFESDMRTDAALVASSIAQAAELLWRSGGEDAARQFVDAAAREHRHVQVRWRAPDSGLPDSLAARHFFTEQVADAPGGPGAFLTLAAVHGPDGRIAAVELVESLAPVDTYLRRTARSVATSTAVLVVLCALAAALLGWMFIARPTRLLIAKARSVGAGDTEIDVVLAQHDELGELAHELNMMAKQIGDARARTQAETRARLAAVEQLRHADRLMTVGKLASGLAHELGTPLNVILGRAELVAAGEAEGEEARESARVIADQSRRMTQILRRLLDFARRSAPVRGSVDLDAFAQRALGILETLARKSSVALALEPPASPTAVAGDAAQLEQVLANLVVNAVHATGSGGRVVVSTGRAEATPPADHGGAPGTWAFLRVRDNGSGMDEATRQRIFEPFFTTKDVGAGTGLGLSIAYGIVRDHGGWLEVESALGRGSTFTVWLPIAPEEAARPVAAAPAAQSASA